MTSGKAQAREFLVQNRLYEALVHDGGQAKAKAVKKAEASLATVTSTLLGDFENDVRGLISLLMQAHAAECNAGTIDDIARANDRIVDVAETLGYPFLARIACNLGNVCRSIQDGGTVEGDVFSVHGKGLQVGLERRELTGSFDSVNSLAEELRRS